MKKWGKRLLVPSVCILAAAAVVGGTMYYKKYDYSSLLPKASAQELSDFHPLAEEPKAKGMQVAAQNSTLELLVKKDTAETAVLDKRTGQIWYSNPQDRAQDKIANKVAADSLSSQMDIVYYDQNRQEHTFRTYGDCVAKKQFKIQSLKDGVRVTYTIGNLSLGADAIPKYISKERFQKKILSKIKDSKIKKTVQRSYIEDSAQKGRMAFLESTKNSDINMGRVLKGFQEAGYTSEDLKYDNQQAGIQAKSDLQYIVVPLDYKLENDRLSVTIPANRIQEKGGIKVLSIDLMKFFGAGSTSDGGYLFVPSGSGALIDFNNGKTGEELYRQPVYGDDPALANKTRTQVTEPVRMPVFGIKKGRDAVFACITQGESSAAILAGVSGKTNSYNYVYPSFTLRSTSKVDISQTSGSNSTMTIVENGMYSGSLSVSYCFLPRKDADYSGMARYYRGMLTENGTLRKLSGTGATPFYLDIVGAVEKKKFVVGVPYRGTVTMTTYRQAEQILSELRKRGVRNVQMRYLGWFNKGINNDIPSSVKPIGSLGGSGGLLSLNKALKDGGGGFFPDAAFQQISSQSPFYWASKESARYLDQWSVKTADYNRAKLRMGTLYKSGVYDIVSPNALPSVVGRFIPKYGKLGIKGLSVRDLGDILTSDKRRAYPISREVSKLITSDQLHKLQTKYRLMVSGGNRYSLPYASSLVNVPDTGNSFYLLDETIPFYEMVVHGSVDYCGRAGNLAEGYGSGTQLLHLLEYGMAPHYVLSYQSGSELAHTASEDLYSTGYQNWINEAANLYQEVSRIHSSLRNHYIDRYIIHEKGVSETVFDNGVSIYVNYTDQPVTVGGVTIRAKSYAVGGKQN
ncbi:MAG: DUF5696 domain-containing protein [Oscillospiraceae bacterium]|nr:DUF5696 domain-containing protein [Oscillospiraceae bacterium]